MVDEQSVLVVARLLTCRGARQFLTLFRNAQTQGSKEHHEILTHLREKNELAARAEANQRPRRQPRQLRPDFKPVLRRVSGPDEPPEYTSPTFPRPRDSFEGRRRIPHVVATASQHVFLRHKKGPQPLAVGNMLRRKQALKLKTDEAMIAVQDDMRHEAQSEDHWDVVVEEALREQKAGKERAEEPEEDTPVFGYADSVDDSWQHLSDSLSRWRANEVAKTKALIEAVKAEEKLLAEEAQEAKKYGVRIMPTELERIKPYIAYRKVRKTKKRLGTRQRKLKNWQAKFVGLAPDPIKT